MAIIHPGLSQIPSNYGVSAKKALPARNTSGETDNPATQDSLANVNFKATPKLPAPSAPTPPPAPVVAEAPQAPAVPVAPQGTAFGAGGSLLLVDEQPQIQQSSSIDGFLARIANSAKQGIESSGTVLKRCMVDGAELGHNLGKSLGCDERLPGLRGGIGTSISLCSAMAGGLVSMPLALIVGLADAATAK